jgi:hypothetical protein
MNRKALLVRASSSLPLDYRLFVQYFGSRFTPAPVTPEPGAQGPLRLSPQEPRDALRDLGGRPVAVEKRSA